MGLWGTVGFVMIGHVIVVQVGMMKNKKWKKMVIHTTGNNMKYTLLIVTVIVLVDCHRLGNPQGCCVM